MNLSSLFLLGLMAGLHCSYAATYNSDIVYRELGEKCYKNGITDYSGCKQSGNENVTSWISSNDETKPENTKFSPEFIFIDGRRKTCRYLLKRKREVCKSTPQCNSTSYSYSARTPKPITTLPACEVEHTKNITSCDRQCGTGKIIVVAFCQNSNEIDDKMVSCRIDILPCNTQPCFRWSNWKTNCYKKCSEPNQVYPTLEKHCLSHSDKIVADSKCEPLKNGTLKNGKCRFTSSNLQMCPELSTESPGTTTGNKQSDEGVRKFVVAPPIETTTKNKNVETKSANSSGGLFWVWIIVAFVLVILLVCILIVILKRKSEKFREFKDAAAARFFPKSNPGPMMTIEPTTPPDRHDGYWTVEVTNPNSHIEPTSVRPVSMTTSNTLEADVNASLYENEEGEENIYETIASRRKKRKAPIPPIDEKEEEVEYEGDKIMRGDVLYSTINKKKKAQCILPGDLPEESPQEVEQEDNHVQETTPTATNEITHMIPVLPSYMISHEQDKEDQISSFSRPASNVYANNGHVMSSDAAEEEEEVYSIPPDAI